MRILASRDERRTKLRDWRWWVSTLMLATAGVLLAQYRPDIMHAVGVLWHNS